MSHLQLHRQQDRMITMAALVCAVLFLLPSHAWARAVQDDGIISAALQDRVEQLLMGEVERDAVSTVYWNAVIEHGDVDYLLLHLEAMRESDGVDAARVRAIIRCEAHIHWRRGDLDAAAERVAQLLTDAPDDATLNLWSARLADARGQVQEARAAYQRVLELSDDAETERTVRLRLALMGLLGGNEAQQGALVDFAAETDDTDLRNRAAIVLAVQDRPKDALDLFVVEGEGTTRFRSEARVAEWAIRSGDAERAQAASWSAVKAAELRRDRRYALTLLVEAHRMDDSLDALIDRLAAATDLTPDERRVWIDLLREKQRYDEAIELFRTAADGTFSIEMRRELLEMEREAGREDQMIAAYRRLIEEEPDEITWRSGLTQVLLERGDQVEAENLWPDYIASVTSGSTLLACAQAQAGLGLDDLAVATINRMLDLGVETGPGLLFLASIYRDRGRLDDAEATLDRLDNLASGNDSVRFELAEAYEQIGRQQKAVAVMEGIRANREEVAEDLEIRLAWLYSEIGEEEKGLDLWVGLWRRINSVPRRRYVEDRLMSVASRLGKLADIAIDLEEKLLDGTADEREAGLLVRIYTRVNDPVSATEVLGDYMRQTGASELESLTETARIYIICNDYHNYERTIRQMIEVDPEGEGEYLRQLAMSQLERGKPDEAREVLMRLRDVEVDSISREFEAGVLSLAGLRDEAAVAYRKGVAEHPDRIESYLLLAGLMRDLGHQQRAIGMFQYLAETADRDDMFTIAIDGLLNMEADAGTMQWARRITLERLAGREDKNYLYQLLADLSEEVRDEEGQIRALENSIAIAGTRRLSILRECMDLSSNIRGGVFYQPGRGPTNAGNEQFFAFARRLIGLQEAVPPQVFLDLGQAFLADDDVQAAWRTFGLARDLPDQRSYRRNVAGIFEAAGKRKEALRVYERLLRTSPSDVGLIVRVAQLHEQQGRDAIAARFYERGLDLLIRQAPLTTAEQDNDPAANDMYFYWSSNRDAYDMYHDRILRGLLVTLPDESQVQTLIETHQQTLANELALLDQEAANGAALEQLAASPRVQKRAQALRRMLIAFDRLADADAMDNTLLARFAGDDDLLLELARTRVDWGFYDSARRLAETSGRDDETLHAVRVLTGEVFDDDASDLINPNEAVRQLLPLLVEGNREAARALLRRVDLTGLDASGPGAGQMIVIINGVAQVQGQDATPGSKFVRIANRLDDPDLALRFARGWFQSGIDTGVLTAAITSIYDQCVDLLTDEHRISFCRYVADLITEDPKRLATHFMLLSKIGDELEEQLIDPDTLLEALEESSVAVGWQMPVDQLLLALPEDMRAQALDRALRNTPEGRRAEALIAVPYTVQEPLAADVADVVHDFFTGDLQPAKEAGMLEYIAGRIPAGDEPLRNPDNAPLALRMLEKLEPLIPSKDRDAARARRALIWRQTGETDRALAVTLELKQAAEPAPDAYYARSARSELFRVMMEDHPDEFLAMLDTQAEQEGATVAITDERISIIRRLNKPALLEAEYKRALREHPSERKYLAALESHYRRQGQLLDAIATAQQILDDLRNGDDTENAGPTKDQIVDAMVAHVMDQLAGQGITEDMLRDSYSQMADQFTFDELLEQATMMGVTIPAAGTADTLAVETRLAGLFDRLESPLQSITLWRSVAQQEEEKFNKQMESDEEAAPDQTDAAAAQPATGVVAAAAIRPAASSVTISTSTSSVAILAPASAGGEPDAEAPDDMAKVRDAIESDNLDEARQVLRRLWRTFPRDDNAGMFISYPGSGPIASLMWPRDEADDAGEGEEAEAEPTPEEKAEQEARRREQLRGGLATHKPREPREPRQLESAWKVLADHPFAIGEMQRIARSRTANEVQGIKPVVLALLDAERGERGDAIVRDELLSDVRAGRAGEKTLIQLFALLNESPELLTADDEQLLDDLVRLLDPNEARMLSRVAWLYAAIGQDDKALRLYEYCATQARMARSYFYWDPFASDQSVNLPTLVEELREHYDGEALLAAVERVFASIESLETDVTAIQTVAEVWSELLQPAEVAARMQHLFDDLEQPQKALSRGIGAVGAGVFARGGEITNARRCLRAALRTYRAADLPEEMRWSFRTRAEITAQLGRDQLLDLFPDDMTAFAAPDAWLSSAAEEIELLLAEDLLAIENAARPLAIIALQLHNRDATSAAREMIASVHTRLNDDVDNDTRLLIADVARRIGAVQIALAITSDLHEQQQLQAVRFGDLVSDTRAAHGLDAALDTLDQLLAISTDVDLIAAGLALTTGQEQITERQAALQTLADEAAAARAEIEQIHKQRAEWKKLLAEKKQKDRGRG